MKIFLKHTVLAIGGVLFAGIIALLLGFFAMLLWNWLMPEIFGLTTITFWQSWGLIFLSRLLLGHPSSHYHREKFAHKSSLGRKLKKWANTEEVD